MLRITSLALSALLLVACGTTSNAKLELQVQESVGFSFEDIRPAEARMSTTVSGPEGLVTVLGDESISPRPADLIKTVLQQDAGSHLAGKKVQLTAFRFEITDPGGKVDDARLAAVAPVVGILAALIARPIIGAIEDARAVKTVAISAWLVVNGVEVSHDYRTTYQGRVTEANVNEALREYLKQLAAKAAEV